MSFKKSIVLMLLAAILGCNSKLDEPIDELSTIITGELVDYNGFYDNAEFYFRNILDIRRNFTAAHIPIEEDGTFRIDTVLRFPQEITTEYGSIYCLPGDSLSLTIKYFNISDVQGTSGELNNNLREFFKEVPRYRYGGKEYLDTIFQLTPLAYSAHIKQREQEYFKLLEEYKRENRTSPRFENWATDILKSESWYDIMAYPYEYSRRNNLNAGDLELPDSYYLFLNDKDISDFSLFSDYRTMFLEVYYQFANTNPKELVEEAQEYFDKQDTTSGIGTQLSMIDRNAKGLVKELFYAKYFYSFLKMKDARLFDKYFDSTLITNEYSKAELEQEYISVQQFLLNQNMPGANIVTSFEDIHSDVLKSIIEPFQGKVVYIDFWAPSCSPCMKEMEYSKQIQEHFKDEEVIFLFLGNNCNEDTWKATIANEELTGEHILLNKPQYAELSDLFGIDGIPQYVTIDRIGNIVSKNAFRPSTGDYLKKELQRILKENKP